MEPIFNSLDLYTHVKTRLEMPIPTSLKLSVLFKSIQKDFPVDDYMAVIFINYIRCLIKLQSDDILMVLKTSKLKYFKYLVYWKEYMSYLIKYNNKVDKVVDEGIKFINVKEFSNKNIILKYLSDVKNDIDRSKYIINWDNEWMIIDDIYRNKIYEHVNKENFDDLNYNLNNERLIYQDDKENLDKYKDNKENFEIYQDNKEILESFIVKKENFENFKDNKESLENSKDNKENFRNFKDNKEILEIYQNDKEILENSKDNKVNFKDNKENINIENYKVNFKDNFDTEYSPLLKKNLKFYPNTPLTEDNNKYTYKDEEYQGNVIQCKIEDVTIREDTQLFKTNNTIIKKDKDTKEEFFYLNNKKLLKINIIGKGGSSKVYKVLFGNEFYALKIINIEMDSTLKDLLLTEIKLLKDLKNVDGIIKMIDYEILTDNIYILLEYGESVLSTYMKSKIYSDIHLHSNRVKYIWQEILIIVQNIHEKRIIHGDLKPANFVFVKNKLKIIDFGISKTLNSNTTRLDLDMVCGTLNYCAPEIFFENKKRRSSDVWSLGIILHELWYGKTPLDKYKTYLEKKENIINIRKNLKINGSVDEVISKCLHEDCSIRPKVKDLLKDNFVCSDILK